MGRLEQLPDALLHIIVATLDLRSLCALDSTCHTLHTCVSPILPQLDTLHLADTPLSAKHLEKYLSTNTKIHTLTLDCRKLEKKGIKLLLKAHLQKLQLIHCSGISSSTHFLYEIGKHCTNLRSLSLDLFWIEDQRLLELYIENLQQMLKSLHYLEYLSMHGQGREFDAQVFGMLPKFLGPSVKALRIMHMKESDARQLSNVKWNGEAGLMPRVRVVGCQNLQKLSLVLSIITDTLMSILTGNLTCLKELDLEDDPWEVPPAELDLSNWGVQQVANCRNLKRLSLVRGQQSLVWGRGQSLSFRRVNDLGFLLMAQSCKNLESIRLGRFSQVTDTGLNSLLENCSHLHTFELIHMNQTSDLTFHDMSATACSLVAVSLPAANQITSDAVAQLACCKHLKFLNLAFCRSVGDRGLRAVSSLSKLAILDLSGADITDFGLFSLSKGSTPLVSLSLRSCKRLTHTGISALTQGCLPATLEALDLSNLPAVTDHTVVALISSGMQIVDLRLRDCHSLTEACVAALASMEYKGNCLGGSLRVLDLSNNGVTASSLEWFRRPYFPRLRWLGLGRHLATELLARLRGERSSLDITPAGCDLDFGYDGLSAKHGKHWNGSCKEQGGFGTLFDDRDCELCSLSA